MGIEPKFKVADVARRFTRFLEVIEKRQIERLQYLGEVCVKHARELPPGVGFTDQTGNLRSSIGYAIFKDGRAVQAGFEKAQNGQEGINEGQSLAKEISKKYPKGLLLVVVAGMNYAAALEAGGAFKIKSRRGHDVLASAELLAEQELPKMIKALQENIDKAMK